MTNIVSAVNQTAKSWKTLKKTRAPADRQIVDWQFICSLFEIFNLVPNDNIEAVFIPQVDDMYESTSAPLHSIFLSTIRNICELCDVLYTSSVV